MEEPGGAAPGLFIDGTGPDALLRGWLMDNVLSVSPQYAQYILEEDTATAGVQDTCQMVSLLKQPLDAQQALLADQQDLEMLLSSATTADTAVAPQQQQQQVVQQQQEVQRQASGGSSKSSIAAAKPRPKNTKRYKSQAQKEAHKRYRERKRQNITLMEAEVKEKLALLQQLEAENQALQSKARVLETSVRCSTDIHSIMQQLEGVALADADTCSTDSLPDTPCAAPAAAATAAATASACQWRASSSNSASFCSLGGPDAAMQSGQLTTAEAFSSGSSRLVGELDPRAAAAALYYQQQQQEQQQQWAAGYVKQEDAVFGGDSRTYSVYAAAAAPGSAALQYSPGGSSTHGHGLASLATARSGSDAGGSLRAIFEESQQQQVCPGGSAGGAACSSGGVRKGSTELVGSVEQGLQLYKDFLQQAQMLMLQQEMGDPVSAAAAEEELCQLTRSIIGRMQPFLVAQGQGLVYDWNARNLETHCHEDAPDELWPRVLSLMRLTPQQQQDALAFALCLSKLVDKRAELTAQYKALQQQAEAVAARCKRDDEAAGDAQLRAELTGASMEVLQAIAQNLAAYQSLDGVFAHSITSIITGAQMAVAMVQSYPFLPQWHQLMRHLQLQADAQKSDQQAAAKQPTGRRSASSRTAQMGLQHVVRA